jgi:hypothetical protein
MVNIASKEEGDRPESVRASSLTHEQSANDIISSNFSEISTFSRPNTESCTNHDMTLVNLLSYSTPDFSYQQTHAPQFLRVAVDGTVNIMRRLYENPILEERTNRVYVGNSVEDTAGSDLTNAQARNDFIIQVLDEVLGDTDAFTGWNDHFTFGDQFWGLGNTMQPQ